MQGNCIQEGKGVHRSGGQGGLNSLPEPINILRVGSGWICAFFPKSKPNKLDKKWFDLSRVCRIKHFDKI